MCSRKKTFVDHPERTDERHRCEHATGMSDLDQP